MTESTTQEAECLSRLTAELEALRKENELLLAAHENLVSYGKELSQQVQDCEDRYEQRMIAFENMEEDRNWYKIRLEKRTTEDEARFEFEKQHHGRDLSRHRLRGTYTKPAIAALWNQHLKTISWVEDKL